MSIDFGFGKKKDKSTELSGPYFRGTGNSSYDPFTRTLKLDPSIRNLQDEGINRARGMMGELGGTISDYRSKLMGTRDRLAGNNSALTQARVNPILQQSALRRGELHRSHGLRNISGSSFAGQDMNRLAFESARAEGDARALAEADNISAITGIDKDIVNSVMQKVQLEAQLNGYTTDIANQRLQQELAAFGLGKDTTSTGKSSGFNAGVKFDVAKAMTGGTA
jgi:hypothetical protein